MATRCCCLAQVSAYSFSSLQCTSSIDAPFTYNEFFIATGKDATDDFEDVGHSESARETMNKYYVGDIDISTIPERLTYTASKQPHDIQDKTTEFIVKLLQFLVPLAILGLAVGIRFYSKST